MDALRAAIEDAKRDALKRKAITTDAVDDDGERPNKYIRRGDLKRLQQEAAAAARKQQSSAAASSTAAAPADATSAAPAASAAAIAAAEVVPRISAYEVKRRLRVLGEPITLFGEDDGARVERLKAAEVRAHERHHSSMGRVDEYKDIAKAVQDELDRALLAEIDGAGASTGADAAAHTAADDNAVSADPKDPNAPGNKPLLSEEEKARVKKEKAAAKLSVDKSRSDFKHAQDYVLHFLKRLLREWEVELDARDDEEKRSTKGKAASMAQKQTRQYVRPLLKLLKERTVADDVLKACERIATLCRAREYVAANEVYLTLAIGNAPWPMGVTMVGIHERAGREKIFSQHTAHVLNDETQRKYIQALKRLMTYCQHKYPTVPSKMVAV